MSSGVRSDYSKIPSIERLTKSKFLKGKLSHPYRVRLLQNLVREIKKSGMHPEVLEAQIEKSSQEIFDGGLKKVINATGIVLHTNLGRAPLDEDLLFEMAEELSGYCNLEIDRDSGKRGSRTKHLEKLVCLLTGCEAALMVNNNAAAVFLILSTLARTKKVALSRGELVQIGGGFRLPEVFECSGAELFEIGTTNITTLQDYTKAIKKGASLVLKVHQSNFFQSGHTESTSLTELGKLCKKMRVPFVVDLGNGYLHKRLLGDWDDSIESSLKSGASLVCFSADKLLGGPQAGIILGKPKWIAELRNSPLYRALRIGKTEIFLLEGLISKLLNEELPTTLALLSQDPLTIKERADLIAAKIRNCADNKFKISLAPSSSSVGGGTLPKIQLPTYVIKIEGPEINSLAKKLRSLKPAVFTRVQSKSIQIDLRSVLPNEDNLLTQKLNEALRCTS